MYKKHVKAQIIKILNPNVPTNEPNKFLVGEKKCVLKLITLSVDGSIKIGSFF